MLQIIPEIADLEESILKSAVCLSPTKLRSNSLKKSVSLISDSVYRIGLENKKIGSLVPNIYLAVCGKESILINTGPYSCFEEVKNNISSITDIKSISLIVLTSASPDLSSALPLFLERTGKVKTAVHWRGANILSSCYPKADYFVINENRWEYDTENNEKLLFLPASNLYSPEEIQLYLVKQKLLFSSSIFSSFSSCSSLFMDKENYELMKSYHEHYFSNTDMIKSAVEKIKQLKVDMIAPAHGGIIREDIPFFFNKISRVECGSFKGIESKTIKSSKDYYTLSEKVIYRLVSLYGFKEIKSVLNSAGIQIDDNCRITKSSCSDGNTLWERLFQVILDEKGISVLSMVESQVRKFSRQYSISYPAAFKNILINLKSKDVALDKNAVRLHGTKNRIRRELEETGDSLTKCPVTGLKNEVFFRNYMIKEISGSLEHETNSALFFIGLDNIMDINARYGREGGDEALRSVSFLVKNFIAADYNRLTHYLFKLNSAAFSYYIPDCTDQDALETADQIRSEIAESSSYLEKITSSIGVVQMHEYFNETLPPEEIINRIIDTGYSRIHTAKKGGGNTICDKSEEDGEYSRLTDPVLIIDPDIKYAELLTSRLREMGFNSEVVGNGNDAIRLIRKIRPLVIISETMVPGVNGFSIKETMLSDSTLNSIPFIFTSHKKNEEYIDKAVRLNVLYYYSKPYSIAELTGLINNLSRKKAE